MVLEQMGHANSLKTRRKDGGRSLNCVMSENRSGGEENRFRSVMNSLGEMR
jgi:hypothetical protein